MWVAKVGVWTCNGDGKDSYLRRDLYLETRLTEGFHINDRREKWWFTS